MDKNLDFKVNVEVNDNVEASVGRLRELRQEIKNVAAGSEDFRKLRAEMDDIEDSLKSARVGAGNFVDILGEVPGPIGEIGDKASSTLNTLKGFSKLSLGDITKSFADLKDDIVDTFKNLGNLTGITKVYTVINNGLAASFVKVGVGEAAAATGARVFAAALTATGIGALIVGLGLAVSALMDFANAESEATTQAKLLSKEIEYQQQLVEMQAKTLSRIQSRELAELKAKGATEKEIRAKQLEDRQEQEDEAYKNLEKSRKTFNKAWAIYEKENNEETSEASSKAYDAFLAADQAYQDAKNNVIIQGFQNQEAARKEQEDKEAKALQDKEKADQDAIKRRQDNYEKEIEASRQKNQKLIDDGKIAGESTTAAEVKLLSDRMAIMKKYGKDTFDTEEEIRLKIAEAAKADGEKRIALEKEIADAMANTDKEKLELNITRQTENYDRLILLAKDDATKQAELETSKLETIAQLRADFQKTQDDLETARREKAKEDKLKEDEEKLAMNQLEIESEYVTFEEKLERNRANEEILNQMFFETESAKTAALKANADERKAIEQAEFEFKMEKVTAGMDLAMQAGQFLQQIAGKNKKLAIAGVIVEQAGSIGKIIANTAVANAKAAAAMPLTGGMPFVAINTVAAGLSIASAIAAGAKAISQINSAESGGGGGGAASPAAPTPSKFGNGGLANGPLHANGGISTPVGEMEGGEYIVNRASTASFLPLLETINSMGRGMGIDQGNLSSGVENQMMAMSQAPIVKTYVVASDMTNQQEANKRISDIARL